MRRDFKMKLKISLCWPILSFLLIVIVSPQMCNSTLTGCSVPGNLSVIVSKGQVKVDVRNMQLSIGAPSEDLEITVYPDGKMASLSVDNVVVSFIADLSVTDLANGVSATSSTPRTISVIHTGRADGTAQLAWVAENSYRTLDCHLSISPNSGGNSDVPLEVDNQIRLLAEKCFELRVCPRNGIIENNHPRNILQSNQKSIDISRSEYPMSEFQPEYGTNSLQGIINTLVDFALMEIIERLKAKNGGTIHIPDIDERFFKGEGLFSVKGNFGAINGTFRDLTTIRRTEEVIVSHVGLNYSVSSGFGLSVAHMNYDYYRIKWGIFKVSGKLTADVDGMAIGATVSVNYNDTPCTKSLQRLQVTEFGKIRISVTGLGPLNSLISKLLGWVTKKWREDVVEKIESTLQKAALKQLAKFNCERYRKI